MKYITLAIILASQAFAQKAVWLQAAVMVGAYSGDVNRAFRRI
jgi:hypothetical protein